MLKNTSGIMTRNGDGLCTMTTRYLSSWYWRVHRCTCRVVLPVDNYPGPHYYSRPQWAPEYHFVFCSDKSLPPRKATQELPCSTAGGAKLAYHPPETGCLQVPMPCVSSLPGVIKITTLSSSAFCRGIYYFSWLPFQQSLPTSFDLKLCRRAFKGFDIATVAAFTDSDVDRLLRPDSGIVRHKGKISSAVSNARSRQPAGQYNFWYRRKPQR